MRQPRRHPSNSPRADRGGRDRRGARRPVNCDRRGVAELFHMASDAGAAAFALLEGNAAYPQFTPVGKKLATDCQGSPS